MLSSFLSLLMVVAPTLVVAQSTNLQGTVGPTTSLASKRAIKECDITDYGATADGKTDISSALNDAFADCSTGGVVIVPAGDYALSTWVTFNAGNGWALQLDGIITRTGTDGGNMIFIEHGSDFEMFSSTGKGAIQGNGYEFHLDDSLSGPRLLRTYDMAGFSIHDFALVDSPAFHLSMDTCSSGEVYNLLIRGGDSGGLDGIDVWSTDMWIHDVMVTNKDECVTVKSPSKNILVENIYCNWSGGCAMGSLGIDTDISDITYKNIYTWTSNQMYMIKSYGGSGTVSNVVLENFIGHGNAYSLDIDQYWSSMDPLDGDGVQLSNIQITNWTGTEADGMERGPIKVMCADGAPCTGIDISDFAMWTESGDSQWYSCQSAYASDGAEYCLKAAGDAVEYAATTTTVSTAPTGYEAPTMDDDLATHTWGFTNSIPIPTMPASFFPGVKPYSAFAAGGVLVVAPSGASSSSAAVSSAVGSSAGAISAAPSSAIPSSVGPSSAGASSVVVSSAAVSSAAPSSAAPSSAALSSAAPSSAAPSSAGPLSSAPSSAPSSVACEVEYVTI